MSRRTAAEAAAFLVPYLRPGMRVLDCGCGPGSISADLAHLAEPRVAFC
jgi:cyclopropane fatty-acyl-phospholipid synthase-like methyltransferase